MGCGLGRSVGNVVGDITGANQAARGAGQAAQAQEAAARQQLRFAQATQNRALSNANSPQEFAALEQSLNAQTQNLDKQAKLFEALDPAILEAGSQALKLLRGEDASSLNPIRNQRNMQRQQLLNTLRQQLGPGAETSSAGQKALQQFDMETSNQVAGAQQQSLGQLFGIGQSGAAGRGALNEGIGQLANIGGAFGNIAARRVNAINGGSALVGQANQGVLNSAGSKYTQSALQGQYQNQLIGGLIQSGAKAGFGALMPGA